MVLKLVVLLIHVLYTSVCVQCVCVCVRVPTVFRLREEYMGEAREATGEDSGRGTRGYATRGQKLLRRKRRYILLTVVLLLVLLLACIRALCSWEYVFGLWDDKVVRKVRLQLSCVSMSGFPSLCPSH